MCILYSISIETSNKWKLNGERKNFNNRKRLKIKLIDLGEVGDWGRPLNYDNKHKFLNYTDWIWKQKINPSFVLIDGRFRVSCFLSILKFAKNEIKIIFDDYNNREYYHHVEKYLKPVKKHGRQSLFIVPKNLNFDNEELEKDINIFRNIMD